MMEISFRKMRPDDAANVEKVEKACFSMPWSRQSFWEEAAKKEACYLLAVNTENGKEQIIGYAGMWLVFGEGQITNVALLPEYQGKGIASLLLEKIIDIAKMKHITAVTLEVRPSNDKAIRLYEKFGFKSVGRRPHYYLDNNEDAEIMWLTF
ncbi:ribosomal protein S18-alanine N-acetyltransferase [Pectinatus cerevisiiphilus]|uniref:[Ribosomal protein bS18]-alanine N-acetyltransferase n=1 Tax=Pectinatus cerevisiiphilus TaxID=86956 RepID=A0A4R3KAL8_9FIRM|nr:ribosomal-protein-alanine N-acetyltransferase [Pectinatus cerevisiiphilus]